MCIDAIDDSISCELFDERASFDNDARNLFTRDCTARVVEFFIGSGACRGIRAI